MDTTYLADTENEGGSGYMEILAEKFGKGDLMYLVYTDKSAKLDFALLDLILSKPGQVFAERVYPGANALDFQLSSILGSLIAGDKERKYVVLSNDHGYDPVISYWNSKGVEISRIAYRKGIGFSPGSFEKTAVHRYFDKDACFSRPAAGPVLRGSHISEEEVAFLNYVAVGDTAGDHMAVNEAPNPKDRKTQGSIAAEPVLKAKASPAPENVMSALNGGQEQKLTLNGRPFAMEKNPHDALMDEKFREVEKSLPGSPYEGDLFQGQKEMIDEFLRKKGLTGYDVNKLAVILRKKAAVVQDEMVKVFGQEKAAEFFKKTTKSERKSLKG